MLQLLSGVAWYWLIPTAIVGTAAGIGISHFVPGTAQREWEYEWRPKTATFIGILVSLFVGYFVPSPVIVGPMAAVLAYLTSRTPSFAALIPDEIKPLAPEPAGTKVDEMVFRKDWNIRPRFETEEEGMFVGRGEFLDRLTSHFISRGGGTILISGVRGVGKTALVDRALVKARRKLQNRYWKDTAKYFNAARPWHFIDRNVRRTLLRLGNPGSSVINPNEYMALKEGAERYVNLESRWWWKHTPVDKRIRKLHKAARYQLFVLKFSASDISGAMAEPGQESTGKPRINPEKLLRSVIRKLFMTCHSSRQEEEAKILKWSLADKAERTLFFSTLEAAYNKSISKSYKEIITNSLNEFIKRTQSSTVEGKMSVEKVVLLLLCLTLCVGAALAGWTRAWNPLQSYIASGAAGVIGAYFAISWTFKRSRETSSDRARQAQASYEYDYSLDQMQRDLELIVRTLHPTNPPFNPFRCFTRSVIVFDELDKLEQADKQLDDVITHFKNFFTLSRAVFVFLTDHDFYEYLTCETMKAQMERHYPPQHTFFTEKIYLRKPEFARFREAFYQFTEPGWLQQRARSTPPDPMLVDDLLKKDEQSAEIIESLPLETLTQLFIQRGQYKREQSEAIEREFDKHQGWSNAFALAQIWASQASIAESSSGDQDMRKMFHQVGGWQNSEAVSFLYHRRDDFSEVDQRTIRKNFGRLSTNFLGRYESVNDSPFTLSDLARALCFQTRDHYFDLYNTVYDYVGAYEDGAPVLLLDNSRFAHEPRLWSRYQQLVEIAFDSARENHPSREYFNALLIESLYRAFDKRGTREHVKIGDIFFSPANSSAPTEPRTPDLTEPVELAPAVAGQEADLNFAFTRLIKLASQRLAAVPLSTAATNGGGVQIRAYSDRDAEKINQAIIRLLRLALAHNAIEAVSTDLESSLKNDKAKPTELAELEFIWKDNSHSIIRSTNREQHEQELVKFWDKYRDELESVDAVMAQLWANAPIDGESARLRSAIGELRSKAEGVRLRTIKISGPDASTLKTNVGTAESREALWPRAIIDRIRAEEDADIFEDIDRTTTDPRAPLIESRRKEFEANTRVRVRTIICPRNTDATIYFVAGPVPTAAGFSAKNLKVALPEKTFLFWYIPALDEIEFDTIEGVNFYSSPLSVAHLVRQTSNLLTPKSCATLVADYIEIASNQRLSQILLNLETTDYKDATLVQRAGVEILGPINGQSQIGEDLSQPGLAVVMNLLNELRDLFAKSGSEAWRFHGFDTDKEWVAEQASGILAKSIIQNSQLKPAFEPLIDKALSHGFKGNVSKFTADSWVKAFLSSTSEPNTIAKSVFAVMIEEAIATKVKAGSFDSRLQPALVEHFVPWLVQGIEDIAKARGKDVVGLLSVPEWLSDLEKLRRSLRVNPLAPTPSASASPGISSSRRRSPPSRA